MKRMSGRIGIGLGFASVLLGACFTQGESGEALPEPATPMGAAPSQASGTKENANDVVVTVRSQLERAFGKTNTLRSPGRSPSRGISTFDVVGTNSPSTVEVLGSVDLARMPKVPAADVSFPSLAQGAFQVRDTLSGVSVEVGLIGATAAPREDANGYVVYRGGYAHGAHIIQRPTEQGTEDYVFFPDTLPDVPELRYEISLGQNVAGLRLVEDTLELLDAGGAPRLRMSPPYAVDGDARRLALHVGIEGCAYDTSTDLPWDRPVVKPGATHCTVRLSWDSSARAPLVVDPVWAKTSEMSVPRLGATSSELPGQKNRVIVVGGDPGDPAMAYDSTEVFDEHTNSWALYRSMLEARTNHAMVAMLVGNNVGGIVVTGGRNANGVIAGSEKLEPSASGWSSLTGTMTPTPMTTPREHHTATLAFLEGNPSGTLRILVTGGLDASGNVLKSMEGYLVNGQNWQGTLDEVGAGPRDMGLGRYGHTATMGKAPNLVVIAGGYPSADPGIAATGTVEQCDLGSLPKIACFTLLSEMSAPRAFHKAVREPLISPGPRIYFVGGESSGMKVSPVDVYDTPNKVMLGPAGRPNGLLEGRSHFQAMLVAGSSIIDKGSKIVVTGGYKNGEIPLNSVEWLELSTLDTNKNWHAAPEMLKAHARHGMAALGDGRILVFGGIKDDVKSSEVLQCSTDAECPAANPFCADGFCCDTACKGVCEACNRKGPGFAPGTCVAIAGPPEEGHGSCASPEQNDACNGQCGGFDRDICVFPDGKSCGTTCVPGSADTTPQSTLQQMACDVKGMCNVVSFETSCGTYTCTSDKKVCNTKCTKDGGCITGYECDEISGLCAEAQFECSTQTENGVTQDVVRSTADNDRIIAECGFYRCDSEKIACRTSCVTAYDCIGGFTCDSNNSCIAKTVFEEPPAGDVTCATSPANQSSRFGWLAALALAGAFASRRNRARA